MPNVHFNTQRNSQIAAAAAFLLAAPALAQVCGPWERTQTPSPGQDFNRLLDVASPRADLAISVGFWNGGGFFNQPIVQRWNGSTWNNLALPATSALGSDPQVEGVGRVPGDDIWVVGHLAATTAAENLPLVMRWRNDMWDNVSTPLLRPQTSFPFFPRGGFAQDIAGVSANDLWVVGSANAFEDGELTSVAMALHWNGSAWTDVDVPPVGGRSNAFDKVSASSPTNVWAIGVWRDLGNSFKSLIMRWDGTQWQRIANLGEGLGGGSTAAVVALAPDDVWVSGLFNNANTRLLHWNGNNWVIPSPMPPGVITSFAAISPTDIWGTDSGNGRFYHYDGVSWSASPTPPISGATQTTRGVGMDTYGPCQVWAVGGYAQGNTQFTLAERLRGGCRADFNNDSTVDFFDYLDFVNAFSQSQPGSDFNGDAIIDFFDYLDFVQAFSQGC